MDLKKITTNKVAYYAVIFSFGVIFLGCDSANAATLQINSNSASLSPGGIATLSVVLNSESVAINNAEAKIVFPADLLEVVSISKGGSIFSLWVEEPVYSNITGIITFNGGIPTPGFNGSYGTAISVIVKAKKTGQADLIFSDAAVRANDGLGTDVLSTKTGKTISIVAKEGPIIKEIPTSESTPSITALQIISPTHPDQTKWYADNAPEFSWELPPGALEVRTIIGKSSTGNPSVSYIPPITKKKVEELPGGTYYFALQARTSAGWSTVSRYRVNIDTVPPKPFSIVFPHGNKGWEPQPVVFFNATDNESGISHYEIKIGSDAKPIRTAPVAQSNPYVLPPQVPGTYTLFVSAIDNAGNIRNSSGEFTIESIDAPIITYYPETMESGEILKIRGTTYPNSDVTVFVREGNSLIAEEYTRSNSSGDFAFAVTKQLDSGVYTFTVLVKDGRGAQSIETSPLKVSVRSEFIADLVSFVLKYLSAAILILLALGGIAWVGVRMWFKIPRTIARMRREAREAERATERAFKVLREGVARHVIRLKKADRKLTKEETAFLEEFENKLVEAEDVIAKEIKDISES